MDTVGTYAVDFESGKLDCWLALKVFEAFDSDPSEMRRKCKRVLLQIHPDKQQRRLQVSREVEHTRFQMFNDAYNLAKENPQEVYRMESAYSGLYNLHLQRRAASLKSKPNQEAETTRRNAGALKKATRCPAVDGPEARVLAGGFLIQACISPSSYRKTTGYECVHCRKKGTCGMLLTHVKVRHPGYPAHMYHSSWTALGNLICKVDKCSWSSDAQDETMKRLPKLNPGDVNKRRRWAPTAAQGHRKHFERNHPDLLAGQK
jgi:hypothetical protein